MSNLLDLTSYFETVRAIKGEAMEERCMLCDCTKDVHQIYHFESGCWCTKCIDTVMSKAEAEG